MRRESAARASRRGHPCSCGRVIHGNGYSRHRIKCGGTWITWTAWEAARPKWTHDPGDDPRCVGEHDWETRHPGDLAVCRRCWTVESDATPATRDE